MTLAPITPLADAILGLTSAEADAARDLDDRLRRFTLPNFSANAFYTAGHALSSPGFTIPQDIANRLAPVAGAPATVVDVLDERLEFLGWDEGPGDALGLSGLFDANELDSESSMAHLDALIYGTSFARVGTGEGGPLVTVHPPTTTTGVRDPATRRLRAAWTTLDSDDEGVTRGVLDLPDVAVTLRSTLAGGWTVEDRDEHRMGRVPVVQFTNRPRASRRGGQSEITAAIRSLTEDMMRAALGMNVNTMFYSIPQLMILGRGPDAFKDRDGNVVPGWKILAGHALAINKDGDGDVPTVHQLTVSSPTPFIEQLREFRIQIASEAGMPADYMGIQTSNPSSADAIRMGESRLVKRTERRQSGFGRSWMEVGRLAMLVRDGEIPTDFNERVSVAWQSAATPTRAATADEVTKLVSAGILAPDSAVVRKRLGLSRTEQRMLEVEQRRAAGANVLEALRNRAGGEPAPAPVTDDLGG